MKTVSNNNPYINILGILCLSNSQGVKRVISVACTYMFPGDGAYIIDIVNLSLMLDHPHSNGVLTDLRNNVALHFEAKVFQNEDALRRKQDMLR